MKVNGLIYILIVFLATILALLMELGIPILIVGFSCILFNLEFSWIPVIFLWIFIQTVIDIRHATDYYVNMINKNGD